MNQYDVKQSWQQTTQLIEQRVAPVVRPLLAAGVVVTIVSSFLPWIKPHVRFTVFPEGHLEQTALAGHRIYLLVLALIAATGLLPKPRVGRRVVLAPGIGVLAISVYELARLEHHGGGLGALGVGTWFGVVGGVLLTLAGLAVSPERDYDLPRLPIVADLALLVVGVGGFLALIVIGLAINDSDHFIAYAILIITAALAANTLGANELFSTAFERLRPVALLLSLAAAVAFPFTQDGNAEWIRVGANVGVFAAAAIGLNVVVGLAGLLDLGYIAFFGIGGYVSALFSDATFTTLHVHLPFILVIPLGALVAAAIGVVIGAPTLRLRGDYLAIVTLAFGEMFRIIANNWDGVTRGPNGISGIPDLNLFGYQFGQPHNAFGVRLPFQSNYYFLDIVLVGTVMLVFSRLNDSRIGRAWVAIREDETAARAMGVNTVAYKLLAFGIGAFLAGTSGTINAHIGEQVSPDSYVFLQSALLLAAVVLGGMATVPGAVLGAALLYGIPEKLRFIQSYRLLIFGAILVLLMRFRPEGIIASRRRQREFHESGEGGDALGAPVGGAATT